MSPPAQCAAGGVKRRSVLAGVQLADPNRDQDQESRAKTAFFKRLQMQICMIWVVRAITVYGRFTSETT